MAGARAGPGSLAWVWPGSVASVRLLLSSLLLCPAVSRGPLIECWSKDAVVIVVCNQDALRTLFIVRLVPVNSYPLDPIDAIAALCLYRHVPR